MAIKKTYIYANGQILAQHDGNVGAPRYFYMHDRLGSVRQVIDVNCSVVKHYTYKPFGETLESAETDPNMKNPFMFTGQYFDGEIDEYFLRARMYDPHIGRFTARDPVKGNYQEPMTLHKYLYCMNDPINHTDPAGEFLDMAWAQSIGANMRKMSLAMGTRVFALAGEVYAAAFAKAVAIDLFIYNLMYQGRVDVGLFRSEWGKWGGSEVYRYHGHLPWGPGLGTHHLPYEFVNWWKNFYNVFFE